MAKEKGHDKRALLTPEEEIMVHKRRSDTASTSNSSARSSHKHDYEKVIVQNSIDENSYYWAKRCKVCGRVDTSGEFKKDSQKGLIKKIEKVKIGQNIYSFTISYNEVEIKKMFPGTSVLRYDLSKKTYEEL